MRYRESITATLTLALLMAAQGCSEPSEDSPQAPSPGSSDDVVELALRRLSPEQDVEAFAAARDAFVERLREQPGVTTDRELEAFFDFSAQGAPSSPVFVGMTQYDDLAAFEAAGQSLGGSPEAAAFFSTFTPITFTALRPLEEGSAVELDRVASAPGQVLEIAVRDLSSYEGFDQATYEAARDEFLALLRSQPGFVAEYQWVSALDPDLVVGMTVYESQEAFFALLSDEGFVNDPATAGFLFAFPPTAGYVNSVIR